MSVTILPSGSTQRATVSLPIADLGFEPVPTPEGPSTPMSLRLEFSGSITGRRLQYQLATTLYARLPDGEIAHLELLDHPADARPSWHAELLQQHQPAGWSLPASPESFGTVDL